MASSGIINQFNEQWRSSPLYQQGLQAVGEPTNGPITLNDQQRKGLLTWMQQNGVQVPQGAEIDPAGNANEDEGWSKHKKWAIPAAAAAASMFIPGVPQALAGIGKSVGSSVSSLGSKAMSGLGIGGGGGSLSNFGLPEGFGVTNEGLIPKPGGSGVTGFLGGLGKKLGGDLAQRFLGGAGAGIAGASQSAAHNRGVALDAELEAALIRQRQQEAYENQLIQRSQDDRDSLTDAFTKSVQANRVLNSTGYQPAMLSQRPGQAPTALPSFGTGAPAPTAQMKSDASALYNQIQPRLTQGSQLPKLAPPQLYQNDPNLMKPGAGEKIGNWLGPALSFAGAYRNPSIGPATPPYNPNDPRNQGQR
jgi:hypothetical protein